MSVLIRILEVIFSLTLLVFVHELGHFLAAKMFHIRVEKFYIFFDLGFALFRWKPKGSETEYGIGWLPLGGYCKIAGMVDESMDKEQMKQPPQPYEFRSHPAWQRFIVMIAGVFNNFIMAIVLYACVFSTWGNQYIKNTDAVYGIATNQLSQDMGFKDGDKILAFDGVPTENFDNLQVDMARAQAKTATVLRGGDTLTLDLDSKYLPAVLNTPGMFDLAFPFIIASVPDTSWNASAGLRHGDKLVAIDGKPMYIVQSIQSELTRHRDTTILATIARPADTSAFFNDVAAASAAYIDSKAAKDTAANVALAMVAPTDSVFEMPLQVDTAGKLCVLLYTNETKLFHVTDKRYNFFTAIPAGASKAWQTGKNYLKELGLIFTPKTKAYKSVGSFIRIGQVFPPTWNWHAFWLLTAWLSIMLAVLNIIPIPGLDGGHILFVLVEMITGKKPSDKFLEVAETIGLILLVMLMILAFGNDIRSLFH
jgi:regulator of sigma E protease